MRQKLAILSLIAGAVMLAPITIAVMRKPPLTPDAFEPLLSFDLALLADGKKDSRKVVLPALEEVRKNRRTAGYAIVPTANAGRFFDTSLSRFGAITLDQTTGTHPARYPAACPH